MATARVLVVDDEPTTLELARFLLATKYEVCTAPSPRQALEIVRTNPRFDLVIADVDMPEMQGPQLLGEISRISPLTAGMLISGTVTQSELPGIPFLSKPLSPDELFNTVREILVRVEKTRADLRKNGERTLELIEQAKELHVQLSKATADATEGLKNASRHCSKKGN